MSDGIIEIKPMEWESCEKFEATIEGITLNDDGTITVFGHRPLTERGRDLRKRYEERIKKSLTPEVFMKIYNDDSGEENI